MSTDRRSAPCPQPCGQVHSHTADGTRWCWTSASRPQQALDVEQVGPIPEVLRGRFTGSDDEFWVSWTAWEVVAKLTDTPMLALVGRGALNEQPPAGIALTHFRGAHQVDAAPGIEIVGCLGHLIETAA